MKITISPAQRFQLLALSHAEGNKIPDGQAGRRYRRFMRAFGISQLAEVAREHGRVQASAAGDEKTRDVVEVDAEAIEYALTLANSPRTAAQEDILGSLFDDLDNIHAGRPYTAPEGATLDAERDRVLWLPEDAE
jgi:hypothetical protein